MIPFPHSHSTNQKYCKIQMYIHVLLDCSYYYVFITDSTSFYSCCLHKNNHSAIVWPIKFYNFLEHLPSPPHKMCLSKVAQLLYGSLALCIIGLTLASMFTPGWRSIQANVNITNPEGIVREVNETINKGLFPFACAISTANDGGFHIDTKLDACQRWWEDQPTYEKVVIAFMMLALVVSVAALLWNVLTFFCCIGRGGVFRPLPSLASTASICLLVALVVFYFNKQKDIETMSKWTDAKTIYDWSNTISDVSYSFYLALGAMILSLANVIIGSAIVQTAEKCL